MSLSYATEPRPGDGLASFRSPLLLMGVEVAASSPNDGLGKGPMVSKLVDIHLPIRSANLFTYTCMHFPRFSASESFHAHRRDPRKPKTNKRTNNKEAEGTMNPPINFKHLKKQLPEHHLCV